MSAEVDPAAFADVIADTPDHLARGMATENRAPPL